MASKKQALDKYNQGKVKSALNIAKNFKLGVTDEERAKMALGYECFVHEQTYVQMGYDVEKARMEAISVLEKVLEVEKEAEVVELDTPEIESPTDVNEELVMNDAVEVLTARNDVSQDEISSVEEPVDNEVVEMSEPPQTIWILLTSRRKDERLYASVLKTYDIDRYVQACRREKYQFVCLVSLDKLTHFLTSGSDKGMKGVLKALANKITVAPTAFYESICKHFLVDTDKGQDITCNHYNEPVTKEGIVEVPLCCA